MRRSLLLLCLLLAAGCAGPEPKPPPVIPLAEQALEAPLGRDGRQPARVAIAPVSYDAADAGENAYSAAIGPLDLQAELARVVGQTGFFGEQVVELPVDGGFAAADELEAQFLLELQVDAYRVRYVRANGLMWWFSVAIWWFAGPPFGWTVPDEVFDARLEATLNLYHVRSRELLGSRPISVVEEQPLDDFDHGWHFLSWLRLPESMDEDNWLRVEEFLRPALLSELTGAQGQAVESLLSEVPSNSRTQRLLTRGTPERARTYALVIGVDGPASAEQRLRYAERDAEAFAGFLEGQGLQSEHIRVLLGDDATKDAVRKAFDEYLAPRALGEDQVIVYFAGYGLCLPGPTSPRAALVLRDTSLDADALAESVLFVDELATLQSKLLAQRCVFVLDTSFGGAGGRTLAGGVSPQATSYLHEIADASRGLSVLAAAGPAECAWETNAVQRDRQHGIFTFFLLRAKERNGGVLALADLQAGVARSVSEAATAFWGIGQGPRLLGLDGPLVIGTAAERRR